LVDARGQVFVITSDLSAMDRLKVLTEFQEVGGILITTSAALQGVDIEADLVVDYGSFSPTELKVVRVRARPTLPDEPLKVMTLVDDSRDEVPEN
jgi:superfamily II DNA/RNA helicase